MHPQNDRAYAVGIDFGTESGRAVVIDLSTGKLIGSAEKDYQHGVIDDTFGCSNERLPFDTALHDADDYLDMLPEIVRTAIGRAGIDPSDVIALGIDSTASTPLPTLGDGTPLSRLDELRDNHHSFAKLWKHHAARVDAEHINEVWGRLAPDLLATYGGAISSEWLIPKALEVRRLAPDIFECAERFIEVGDWVVWQLTGREVRSFTGAGYKGCFQEQLGGYPTPAMLDALADGFSELLAKIEAPMAAPGTPAGTLEPSWQQALGLGEIAVAVANVDAHAAVMAAGTASPGAMLAVMGTSVCNMLIDAELHLVPGMSGVVRDGITPGSWGYEAGQAGVGDSLAWFVRNMAGGDVAEEAQLHGISPHQVLIRRAADEGAMGPDLVALEWINGNRSVLVDPHLSGLIMGMTLDTRPHHIYRALLEAACFGQRIIIDTFARHGIAVEKIVAAGGLARKNPLLMQLLADVTGLPVSVTTSENLSAAGAALHAAVACGHFADHPEASAVCAPTIDRVYSPRPNERLERLRSTYEFLHQTFGIDRRDLMYNLKNPTTERNPS